MTCHQETTLRAVRMLPPQLTLEVSVERIAAQAMSAMAETVRREMEELRRLQAKRAARDRAIQKACKAVGDAVDRLEQARHTSGEIAARQSVERAATQLRRVMRRKDDHAKR